MTAPKSRLTNLHPIHIEEVGTDKNSTVSPNPALFANIPLLWKFLELIVQDWQRDSQPFQEELDKATTEGQEIYHVIAAMKELKAPFLKGLFSYAMFFVAADRTYKLLYSRINSLNRVFRVQHDKPPKRNDYVKKVRSIRNISISHPSSDRARRIDAFAAIMWDLTIGKKSDASWDLDEMEFASGRWNIRDEEGNVVEQSMDLEIVGIPELHTECMKYLDEYDQVCATYFESIVSKLPIQLDGKEYSIRQS